MSALFSLHGRRALVTGSSTGIGREILLTFARAGADVVVHGLEDTVSDVVAEAGAFGVSAGELRGDLQEEEAGRKLAQAYLATFGSVDIVVLNASVQIRKDWREIEPVEFQRQMNINLQSSIEILQTLLPPMCARKWGRILSIGSVQQTRPHPDMLVYSASKAAQHNIVLSLAKKVAAYGVTINTLAPGVVCTGRNAAALSDASYAEKVRESIPAGHFGEPSDCAGAALLLCSEAGRYITGQNLYVDGGLSLP